jgi:prophage maintenance system killer protein
MARLMRFVSLAEVLHLHRAIIETSGGAKGLRDLGLLESAVAQPRATFDGDDLYPVLVDKATALGFAIIQGGGGLPSALRSSCRDQTARMSRPS